MQKQEDFELMKSGEGDGRFYKSEEFGHGRHQVDSV